MCCFSKTVELVSDTHIFARGGKNGRQYLVYEMTLRAKEALAMILPLPTPPRSPEQAVKFISLKECAWFFKDIDKGFPLPPPSRSTRPSSSRDAEYLRKKLEVVKVGNFEASFVPTVADFGRLDQRFRLPTGTWAKLPAYAKYGFAVFKLKSGDQEVHPMAFSFPRVDASRLFFPTVHIHDGEVHDTARFDHALYCQTKTDDLAVLHGWEESFLPAVAFLDKNKCGDLIAPDAHIYRRLMQGNFKNTDVFLQAS